MSDYKIVSGRSAEELTRAVNAHIERGYLPQGGVSLAIVGSMTMYKQAVIKAIGSEEE